MFYVYGYNVSFQLLSSCPQLVSRVYFSSKMKDDPALVQLLKICDQKSLASYWTDSDHLTELVQTRRHQGIVAQIIKEPPTISFAECLQKMISQSRSLLILDGVTDPHNLGACLRVAHLAGSVAVLAPKDHCAPLNSAAFQVSSGAGFLTPYIRVPNLSRALKELDKEGIPTVGTVLDTEQSIYDLPSFSSCAWVMGSEGSGLRRLTRESCQFLAKIPTQGVIDSLNVSVSAGICLFSQYSKGAKCS